MFVYHSGLFIYLFIININLIQNYFSQNKSTLGALVSTFT